MRETLTVHRAGIPDKQCSLIGVREVGVLHMKRICSDGAYSRPLVTGATSSLAFAWSHGTYQRLSGDRRC